VLKSFRGLEACNLVTASIRKRSCSSLCSGAPRDGEMGGRKVAVIGNNYVAVMVTYFLQKHLLVVYCCA
jgi:hypothetical protein